MVPSSPPPPQPMEGPNHLISIPATPLHTQIAVRVVDFWLKADWSRPEPTTEATGIQRLKPKANERTDYTKKPYNQNHDLTNTSRNTSVNNATTNHTRDTNTTSDHKAAAAAAAEAQ
ncbi:unnamed protein product [Ectocarpus sp. 8 AP-2014]